MTVGLPNFLLVNRIALERLKNQYVKAVRPRTLAEAFKDDPWRFAYNLKALGIRCVSCGGLVSAKNLAFYNFMPDVKCYRCQGH